jgi:MarR family transcriptional regulator, organic hydroperoxide resistance regulator
VASAAPEELVTAVHEVMGSVLRRLTPALESEGITMGQFWALKSVSSLGRTSLTSMARQLAIAPPTVCGNVDLLVKAGLVARHRSQRDRRAVELSLTPAGRRVEARVWRAVAQVMAPATAELAPGDVATATRVFRAIRAHLDDADPAAAREAA